MAAPRPAPPQLPPRLATTLRQQASSSSVPCKQRCRSEEDKICSERQCRRRVGQPLPLAGLRPQQPRNRGSRPCSFFPRSFNDCIRTINSVVNKKRLRDQAAAARAAQRAALQQEAREQEGGCASQRSRWYGKGMSQNATRAVDDEIWTGESTCMQLPAALYRCHDLQPFRTLADACGPAHGCLQTRPPALLRTPPAATTHQPPPPPHTHRTPPPPPPPPPHAYTHTTRPSSTQSPGPSCPLPIPPCR